MHDTRGQRSATCVSRREVVRTLGTVAAGLCSGCAPMRLLLDNHAPSVAEHPALEERVLRAFALTVVPGAEDTPALVRAFYDRERPYAEFGRLRPVFVGDLCRRAERRFGTARFDLLDVDRRSDVVRAGLSADPTTQQLYAAAVFLTQVTFYSGAFDDSAACDLIEYEGPFRLRSVADLTYPEPERFLPTPQTLDGHPS